MKNVNYVYAIHTYKNVDEIASIFKNHIQAALDTIHNPCQLINYVADESKLARDYMNPSEPVLLGFVEEGGHYIKVSYVPEPRDSYSCARIYDSNGQDYTLEEFQEKFENSTKTLIYD